MIKTIHVTYVIGDATTMLTLEGSDPMCQRVYGGYQITFPACDGAVVKSSSTKDYGIEDIQGVSFANVPVAFLTVPRTQPAEDTVRDVNP